MGERLSVASLLHPVQWLPQISTIQELAVTRWLDSFQMDGLPCDQSQPGAPGTATERAADCRRTVDLPPRGHRPGLSALRPAAAQTIHATPAESPGQCV